jgi:hypothetical protein
VSPAQAVVSAASYQPSGALASYTLGNGVVTTIAADGSGLPRPSRISTSSGGFDTGAYVYDGAGNVKSIGADTFVYDARSRLTTANYSGSGSQAYAYDVYGNLATKAGTVLCTGGTCAANRITAAGYGYDGRGNLTSAPSETLSYDGLDRQVRDVKSGVDWKYGFDGAADFSSC